MPVVVFKGIQGLADRLQMLSHCIEYCKTNNTLLCVDWEDHVWGGLDFDFYRVFSIDGVKTMRKYKVISLLKQKQIQIEPPFWTPNEIIRHMELKHMGAEFQGTFQNSFQKVSGEILVTNGEGTRSWNCKVIADHLRFKPEIVEAIQKRLGSFTPQCFLIHLRGTDRSITPEKLQDAIKAYNDVPYKKYVVTDEKELWEQFKAGVPDAELVNPNPCLFRLPKNNNGTHQHHPTLLREYGISKWEMMIDLLTDFTALILADKAGGRMESTFFGMARGIHNLGREDYKKLFNGWTL